MAIRRSPPPTSRLLALAALTFGAGPLASQGAAPQGPNPGAGGSNRPVARAARVELGPALTGRLDDSLWLAAPVISDFLQHEPFEGQPATERTEVRILYDSQRVYLGVIFVELYWERVP